VRHYGDFGELYQFFVKKKAFYKGFSLIEVSISLLIIGIISGIGVTQLNMFNKFCAIQKTQSNIDFVIKAIAAYCIAKDGRLPFPSSSEFNIGIQDASLQNTSGVVPFKTLGIMEKFAQDGKGRWLVYRMNPTFGAHANGSHDRKIGITDFHSEISDDQVAIVLKSQNEKNMDEIVIWISEKVFIANFMNGKIPHLPRPHIGLFDEAPNPPQLHSLDEPI
jgi:prepilin-type N-terminal cleavage/methylation domain-containing protein